MTQTATSSTAGLQASFESLLEGYDRALAELEAANAHKVTAARNVAISLLRANRHWIERARDFGTTELPWGSEGFPLPPPMTAGNWETAQRDAEIGIIAVPGAVDLLQRVVSREPIPPEELARNLDAVAALAAAHLVFSVEGQLYPLWGALVFLHDLEELDARLRDAD
jgi:hypothetical protein